MTGTTAPTAPSSVPTSPPPPDPGGPALAPPPSQGALHRLEPSMRTSFKALNRWFMVPVHRAGLGAWVGSPVGGCMLLLRVRGRKSGLVRETPLNYLVADGSVWVLAGFGVRTEWYRNLLADPRVEAWLPGRRIAGTATEVRAPAIRERIIPALLRATGLPTFLAGVNPWTSTPERLLAAVDFVPLVRIDADEGWLEPGPDDPGGRAWIWRQAVVLGASLALLGALCAGVRRLR